MSKSIFKRIKENSMSLRTFGLAALAVAAVGLMPRTAQATPAYAMKEKATCDVCHQVPGGPRNFRGLYYAANNHSFAKFDEVFESKAAGVKAGAKGGDAMSKTPGYPKSATANVAPVWQFTAKDIEGKTVNLGRYQGQVALIVNVASKCGNTPQYADMEALYEKYKEQGLVVLGFPANEFGAQEPGTNAEIKEFCEATYKVKFPMFSKIVVKGEGQDPLYKFLTNKETNPKFGGDIEWNFAKFLVNRKGEIIARIPARTKPTNPETVALIEKALAEK
jgi:glutathione peroxidase